MSKELAQTNQKAELAILNGAVNLTNVEQAFRLAEMFSKAGMLPRGIKDVTAGTVAILYLSEIGAPVIRGMQRVAVINGTPTIWGDMALGMVQGHPDFDFTKFKEWYDGEGEEYTAYCQMARKGMESPIVKAFSVADAKRAGLLSKDTYKQFLNDMLLWKARHRCMVALFSEVLAGVNIKETYVEPPIDVEHEEIPSSGLTMPGAKVRNGKKAQPAPDPEAESAETEPEATPEPAQEGWTDAQQKAFERFSDGTVSPVELKQLIEVNTFEGAVDFDALEQALESAGASA